MTSLASRAALRVMNRSLHWASLAYRDDRNPEWPPIFIVGAPRTGSTVLYQSLTDQYCVGFIDNLGSNFFGSLLLAIGISRWKYKNGPHNSFHSEFGDTTRQGGHAPSECGEFWYRWFPRNEHFAAEGSISPGSIIHLRSEIAHATRFFGGPLLFKNLNAGQRLRVIREAFPSAQILWCQRDQAFTVQSIVAARRRLGWPDSSLWSVRPRHWRDLEMLTLLDQVCEQVIRLEDQIEQDVRLFPPSQVHDVRYEALAKDPHKILEDLAASLGLAPRDYRSAVAIDSQRNRVSDPAEFEHILRRLDEARSHRPKAIVRSER